VRSLLEMLPIDAQSVSDSLQTSALLVPGLMQDMNLSRISEPHMTHVNR
jgi:hypothetical protein